MGKIFRRIAARLLSAVVALSLVGAANPPAERRFLGKSAEDVFKAPGLADLAKAACDGNVKAMDSALSRGAKINGLSIDGGTPLLWAVLCGNTTGVEHLLKMGADPNYRNGGKASATLAASYVENGDVLKSLLRYHGNPNSDDGYSHTALDAAIILGIDKGRWNNYYTLLNSGADINYEYPKNSGLTVGTYAASLEQFSKVAELLDRGYGKNLIEVGALAQNSRLDPGSSQSKWREKVIDMLKARGVKFPVPPLVCFKKDRPKNLVVNCPANY
jgi:hypothetical protein